LKEYNYTLVHLASELLISKGFIKNMGKLKINNIFPEYSMVLMINGNIQLIMGFNGAKWFK